MYNYLTYIDNFPIGDRKLIYDFFFFCYSQKFSNSIIFVLLYILIY